MPSKKYTLQEALDERGMTKMDLIRESGLGQHTIERVLSSDSTKFKTRVETAILIAHALGLTIEQIEWPRGLSTIGRPPLTGTAMKVEVTMTVSTTIQISACCSMTLTADGRCSNCG